MIILLDTSTPVCKLTLVDGDQQFHDEWQAERTLAKNLLTYLRDQLQIAQKTFDGWAHYRHRRHERTRQLYWPKNWF